MELNNKKFNKIPPIPSNIISLNKIPNGLDKMLLSNAKPPNTKCTKLNYFNHNKYLKFFNNKNNDKYLNLVNSQNLPSILQNTTNSNFVRGNTFSPGFFPDDNKSCSSFETPTKTQSYKTYNNKSNPHYPIPSQDDVHNKNYKIYPNQSNYLKKFPFFNIPYLEHLTEVNYETQFFQLLLYLPVILIILYMLSCTNFLNKFTFMKNYSSNGNTNKLKIRKKQNIKSNVTTLLIIGGLCIIFYIVIRAFLKKVDGILSPNCVENPEYDNQIIKKCNISKTNNSKLNCNNCKSISNDNILNEKTSCLFDGKEVGGDKECPVYKEQDYNGQSSYFIDMIFPIYFLSLLFGILLIFKKSNYISYSFIFNFIITGLIFIISYFVLGNEETNKQIGWQIGIGILQLVFYLATSYLILNYLCNALQ